MYASPRAADAGPAQRQAVSSMRRARNACCRVGNSELSEVTTRCYHSGMRQTEDRQTLRHELIRLLTGLDFYRAWRLSALRLQRIGIPESDLENEVVMPGSTFLKLFDDSPARAAASILKEVRVWYSHASSELIYLASFGSEHQIEVRRFLDAFRNEVGFSFHAEAGTLRKVAVRSLKIGKVRSEKEYRLLDELRKDGSQTILCAEELAIVSAMLSAFEAGLKTG